MIVPVFLADLEHNTGIKKVARFLFTTWPGVKPILRTQALDVLAKSLGYENYYHVTKLASAWTEACADVEIHTIEWNLSKVLSDEIKAPGNPNVIINLGNLLAYIQTIPLHHLTVFKRFPELLERKHSYPMLPLDAKSPFGRFQHSAVIPLEDDWLISDKDHGARES